MGIKRIHTCTCILLNSKFCIFIYTYITICKHTYLDHASNFEQLKQIQTFSALTSYIQVVFLCNSVLLPTPLVNHSPPHQALASRVERSQRGGEFINWNEPKRFRWSNIYRWLHRFFVRVLWKFVGFRSPKNRFLFCLQKVVHSLYLAGFSDDLSAMWNIQNIAHEKKKSDS